MNTIRKTALRTGFLLLAIVFLSSSILPQCRLDTDKMELAESSESDMEEKEGKKESEKDYYLSELLASSLSQSEKVPIFGEDFGYRYSTYIDILTPPPQQA